ncbi:MAG: hypothetical protein KDH18_11200 [Rhodoferax sp.]|nr:hypothetical protein [Rhodoferax sp.]
MGRRASGAEELARAITAVATAKSVNELRIAQSVLLPLKFGLSLSQVAEVTGRSVSWVARNRRLFIANGTQPLQAPSATSGGRRNQILPRHEELEFVTSVKTRVDRLWWELYNDPKSYLSRDQINFPVAQYLQKALSEYAGRPVSRATAYNMLSRTAKRNTLR